MSREKCPKCGKPWGMEWYDGSHCMEEQNAAPGGGSQPVDSEHVTRSSRPELGSETGLISAVPVAASDKQVVEMQKIGWQWPVNTVGKLIANLQTLPAEMPFYTAYFVEIEGAKIARTIHPSISRETVSENRIKTYSPDNQSLVMWASQPQPSPEHDEATIKAREHQPKPELGGEVAEMVKRLCEWADNSLLDGVRMDRRSPLLRDELRKAARLLSSQNVGAETLSCELVVGAGHFHAGVKVATAQGAIDRMYERLQQLERNVGPEKVVVPMRLYDAAVALSAFIKHHEYPDYIGSTDFNEFIRLADILDTSIRRRHLAQEGKK